MHSAKRVATAARSSSSHQPQANQPKVTTQAKAHTRFSSNPLGNMTTFADTALDRTWMRLYHCRTSDFASTSAPLAISRSTTAVWPLKHASCSGVLLPYTKATSSDALEPQSKAHTRLSSNPLGNMVGFAYRPRSSTDTGLPLPYPGLRLRVCSFGDEQLNRGSVACSTCLVQWCHVTLQQSHVLRYTRASLEQSIVQRVLK